MANGNEVSTGAAIKTLVEILQNDQEFKKSLGQNTALAILATLAIAVAELTIGLPVITLASAPFLGVLITFLVASVKTWLQSGKPEVIFYICPKEGCSGQRVRPIKWTSLPQYRKLKTCPTCGTTLVTKCPRGKHFIVSPDPANPGTPPDIHGFCPFCDERTPLPERQYVRGPASAAPTP